MSDLTKTTPWAIRPVDYPRVLRERVQTPEAALLIGDRLPRRGFDLVTGGVAVIPVRGALRARSSWLGDRASYEWIGAQLTEALAASDVRAIVLDVDSPGGQVHGLSELVDRIFVARRSKPSAAVVRGLGTSAAYSIASATGRVLVAKEAEVGAIGVVLTILDFRKMDEKLGIEQHDIVSSQTPRKNPDPKTEAGRAQLQRMVDDIADVLTDGVARNRGVPRSRVIEGFGQGDVFVGERAVGAGLADAVGTLDAAMRRVRAARIAPAATITWATVRAKATAAGEELAELVSSWQARGLGAAEALRRLESELNERAEFAKGVKSAGDYAQRLGLLGWPNS